MTNDNISMTLERAKEIVARYGGVELSLAELARGDEYEEAIGFLAGYEAGAASRDTEIEKLKAAGVVEAAWSVATSICSMEGSASNEVLPEHFRLRLKDLAKALNTYEEQRGKRS